MSLLLTLSLGGASAAPERPAWPLPPGTTTWYRLTLLGQPSGYMSSAARLTTGPHGEELLQVEERQVIQVALDAQTLQITGSVVVLYDRDLQPQQWRVHLDKLGVLQQVTAHREGARLHLVNVEQGQSQERDLDLPADFGSELQAFRQIAAGEVAPEQSLTLTVFNPLVADVDQETFTVGAPEALPGQTGGPLLTPVRLTSLRLGLDMRVWLDAEGQLARFSLPTLLGAVGERVSPEEALAALSPVVLNNAVLLDHPLPKPSERRLEQVTLEAISTAAAPEELIANGPRQQVTSLGEGRAQVVIQAQGAPRASAVLPVADPALAEFLVSTPLAPLEDPALRDLARQIVGEETDAWRAAQALSAWVYHNLRMVESEPRPLSALEILRVGSGDCSEHALLMAALARAVGLPTRVITGLAAVGDAFYYHAWVQVWVGEWVEMDPTWDQPGVDAGHLSLGTSGLDALSFARMSLETGRTMGTLSLRLVGFQADE